MTAHHAEFAVHTSGKGLLEITDKVSGILQQSAAQDGVVHVFCRHTSCSLVIMENADPTARRDLERYMERLVPEGTSAFEHTLEGPDDMPSHIRMALTRTTETIPFQRGQLLLGTWQGIYLWEHRSRAHSRQILVTVMS